MTFKDNLKKFRKLNKLSQKMLAELSGVSYSMICKLESGEQSNPSLETLDKISAALKVRSADLIGLGEYFDMKLDPEGTLANEVALFDTIASTYGEESAELLHNFLQLNEAGKEKASEYLADLSEHEKYKK